MLHWSIGKTGICFLTVEFLYPAQYERKAFMKDNGAGKEVHADGFVTRSVAAARTNHSDRCLW